MRRGQHIPLQPIRFNSQKREAVWRKTHGQCFYCGKQTLGDFIGHFDPETGCYSIPSRLSWMQIDHIIPRCMRGGSRVANLTPACGSCNATKGGKTVHEYRRWLMKKSGGALVLFHGEACS